MGHFSDVGSYATGAVRAKDLGYLVLTLDELDGRKVAHSIFVQGTAGCSAILGTRHGTRAIAASFGIRSAIRSARGRWPYLLLRQRRCARGEHLGSFRRPTPGDRYEPWPCIGDKIVAAGTGRQVYLRLDRNVWIDISADSDFRGHPMVGFEALSGASAESLCAVGWNGEIWLYTGGLEEVDSPTNVILTGVANHPTDGIYACGRNGILVRGAGDRWTVLDERAPHDFWDVECFEGKIYLSTLPPPDTGGRPA